LPKVPPALGGTFGGVDTGQTVDSVGEAENKYKMTCKLWEFHVRLDSGKQGMIKDGRACHSQKENTRSTKLLSVWCFFISQKIK
jgi:hypothetical protein